MPTSSYFEPPRSGKDGSKSDNHKKHTPRISLTVGSAAPIFTLSDGYENLVSLTDHLHPRGVLIAFIHGTWCPDCMRGVASLRRTYWFIKRVNVNILVIAKQEINSLSAFMLSQKNPPPFPILADWSGEVFNKYGLLEIRNLHGTRASFFVDQNGIITKINKGLKFGPLTPFGP